MPTSKQKYGVFLSYAHKDAEIYGENTILRIKDAIEDSIKEVAGEHCRVFLDTVALKEGELWHSTIIKAIRECRVFVCLLSESYKESVYCERERLWWNAKETQNGRLLKDTYPIYYVKLNKDLFSEEQTISVKNLASIQFGDAVPWFEGIGMKIQEAFIRKRLDNLKRNIKKKVKEATVSQTSFNSVQPRLCKTFVGRISEMRELLNICEKGNYPIIIGEGGVGKTELSVAYSYGFADKYPSGRYLIPMEGVHNWDDAFCKMIMLYGSDKKGLKQVWHHLGIEKKLIKEIQKNNETQEKKKRIVHEEVIKALIRKASQGRLLILLDNVDDESLFEKSQMAHIFCGLPLSEDISDNIHILATTRQEIQFLCENSVFKLFPLNNLCDDDAFELLCIDGNGKYPFDRNPPDTDNDEYKASYDLIHLLNNHAWSLEIESAFISKNYNNGNITFRKLVEKLKEQFIILNTKGTYRNVGNPEALLNPTLNKIESMMYGSRILDLAAFASCFNADEIPLDFLRYYWENICQLSNFEEEESFGYPINQLRMYHLITYHEHTAKMHRLTHSVLRKRALTQMERIGAFLKSCLACTEEIWTKLIITTPELFDYCPKYMIDSMNVPWRLIELVEQPQIINKLPWPKLSLFFSLLEKYPKSALKIKVQIPWEKLSVKMWASLLSEQPNIAMKQKVDVPWNTFSGNEWINLLSSQPDIPTMYNVLVPWREFSGSDWCWLLRAQPDIASKYNVLVPWGKFSGSNWSWLLRAQPEIATMYNLKIPWEMFTGKNWIDLLCIQPDIALKYNVKIPWEAQDICDWDIVFHAHPNLILKLGSSVTWKVLSQTEKIDLLSDLQDKASHNLLEVPWIIGDIYNWSYLLSAQPDIALMYKVSVPWEKLDGDSWCTLLSAQPDIASKYNILISWEKLSIYEWGSLLEKQPDIALMYKVSVPWEKFNDYIWYNLLKEQPDIALKYKISIPWEKLDNDYWCMLLSEQPDIAMTYKISVPWEKFTSSNWSSLLFYQPDIAMKYKISVPWNMLDGSNWLEFIRLHPQFSSICQWDKLDGSDWGELLCIHPYFASNCRWGKLSGSDWSNLLQKCPKFSERCKWDKLDGGNWSRLLIRQPQFAEKCPWNKLDVDNWKDLLEKQPQFAQYCPKKIIAQLS